MITTYSDFIQIFPYANPAVPNCPNIPVSVNERVTLFRTYQAVAGYLNGRDIPPQHHTAAYTVRSGIYHMRDVGNQGFKRSYLRVFDTAQHHTEHGVYVAWMVHL